MRFNIDTIPLFDKLTKRLIKKYPSLKSELATLNKSLANNPTQGTFLGNNFYKIRIAIESKGKGKSVGGRIISYIKVTANTVFLVYIYDKSEKRNVSGKELEQIFSLLP